MMLTLLFEIFLKHSPCSSSETCVTVDTDGICSTFVTFPGWQHLCLKTSGTRRTFPFSPLLQLNDFTKFVYSGCKGITLPSLYLRSNKKKWSERIYLPELRNPLKESVKRSLKDSSIRGGSFFGVNVAFTVFQFTCKQMWKGRKIWQWRCIVLVLCLPACQSWRLGAFTCQWQTTYEPPSQDAKKKNVNRGSECSPGPSKNSRECHLNLHEFTTGKVVLVAGDVPGDLQSTAEVPLSKIPNPHVLREGSAICWSLIQGCSPPLTRTQMREAPAPSIKGKGCYGIVNKKRGFQLWLNWMKWFV